jgi:hypothetical protein
MRKLAFLTLIVMITFINVSIGQRTDRRAYTEHKSDRQHKMHDGKTKCQKGKKYHKRKMHKMAAADGKVTPRERRMLRRDRRNIR